MPREEPYTTDRARELRASQSPPEGILWSHLRDRRLGGLKFRRQHPIGPIVVDFCCPEAMLVVELDSRFHDGRLDQDGHRDRLLQERGYTVLRVTASEVTKHLDGVLLTIRRTAERRLEQERKRADEQKGSREER